MADMEKVVKGLRCLSRTEEPMANPCAKCDYKDRMNFAFCVVDVAKDALELLKEKEPIKPKRKSRKGTNGLTYDHRCGNCNSMLYGKQKYCGYCGKEVKWK